MLFKINNLNCESVFYNEVSSLIDNEGPNINKIYVAKEYFNKKDNQYKYNYLVLNNVDELQQITTTNNNIYEILQHNKPLKPFMDIDLKLNRFEFSINKDDLLKYILEEYTKIFFKCFNVKIKPDEFIILDGTTPNKISFHIIINNNNFFINITQQKEFIKYIHSKRIILNNKIELNNILDSSVYNKNKLFRIANQSKLKKNDHPFKIISNHEFKDSLIIDYFNTSSNNILNCEFLKITKNNPPKINECPNKIVYNDFIKNKLNMLLSFINPSNFEEYNDWYKIGTAIKNINFDYYDLYDFYSKGHEKYNEVTNKVLFNSFTGSYSWEYLYSISSGPHLSEFVKQELINDYHNFNGEAIPKNIKIINDYNKYIDENLLINSTSKHVLIKAKPGKGKTQATVKFVMHKAQENIEPTPINKPIENKINFKEEFMECLRCKLMIDGLTDDELDAINFEKLIEEDPIINEEYYYRLKEYEKKNNTPNKASTKASQLKILVVSPRIAFSEHMHTELNIDNKINIENYLNIDLKNYSESLIISVESLYKLDYNNKYDIIILDEVESILNQFSSTTCTHRNDSYNILLHFINNSNKIIYSDAFLNSRTYEYINNFHEEKEIILNDVYENNKPANIYKDEDKLINKIKSELKAGKKSYAHFTSKTKGQQVYNLLLEEKIITPSNSIFYSSNETKKEGETESNINKLGDINANWGKYIYISSTSQLTVGNSYTLKDIDSVYIFGGVNSCCIRDSFQNHMRIRHNMGDLNIYIPKEQKQYNTDLLNYTMTEQTLTTELMEIQKNNFFKNNLENQEIYYLLKNEIITDNNLKIFLLGSLSFDVYENMKIKFTSKEKNEISKHYELLLKNYTTLNNNFSSSLDKIHIINKFEKHINNCLYEYIFIDFLKQMKYNINYVEEDPPKNGKEEKEKLKKIEIKYNEINTITTELADQFNKHKKNNEGLTYKQNLELEKYFFNKCFNNEDIDQRKEQIFNNIYSKKDKRDLFLNFLLEFNYYNNNKKFKEQLNKFYNSLINDQTETGLRYNKFFEIIELNNLFNIKGSYNKNIIDAGDLQKKFKKYIKLEGKTNKIKYLFKIEYDLNKIDDVAYNKKIISNIYAGFNGCTFQNNEIKKTNKTDYALNFKIENIFNKSITKKEGTPQDTFNIDGLFKIYSDFNNNIDFI